MIFRDINFYKKLDLSRIIVFCNRRFQKIRYVVIIDKFVVTYVVLKVSSFILFNILWDAFNISAR